MLSIGYFSTNPMLQDNLEIKKKEKTVIYSLSLEVDSIFLKLRKEHEIIRREIILLKQEKFSSLKEDFIACIEQDNFKTLIEKLPNSVMDDYIIYMLEDESNNIFRLIGEYNECLNKRKQEKQSFDYKELIIIDGKLDDYIRRLGAMIYHLHIHLHIHLNLLIALVRNAPVISSTQVEAPQATQEIVSEYIVNEWSEWQQYSGF